MHFSNVNPYPLHKMHNYYANLVPRGHRHLLTVIYNPREGQIRSHFRLLLLQYGSPGHTGVSRREGLLFNPVISFHPDEYSFHPAGLPENKTMSSFRIDM